MDYYFSLCNAITSPESSGVLSVVVCLDFWNFLIGCCSANNQSKHSKNIQRARETVGSRRLYVMWLYSVVSFIQVSLVDALFKVLVMLFLRAVSSL